MLISSYREYLPLFHCDKIQLPSSPKELEIVVINIKRAVELNHAWHSRLPQYNTGAILNAVVCYGTIHLNIFYAVAIWRHPVARLLPQDSWLELSRLAICNDAPKFTATWMLGKMRKDIRRRFPQIEVLCSYQDIEIHKGTIYKADNWTNDHYHPGGPWSRVKGNRINRDKQGAIGPKVRWIYKLKKEDKNVSPK